MAINFKRGLLSDMLQDEQFLVAAGLLSAGSQGQGIGQAAFPALLQAAQIQKAFTPKINKTKAAVDTTIDTSTGESNLVFVSDKQIAENPNRFIPQEKKGTNVNIKNFDPSDTPRKIRKQYLDESKLFKDRKSSRDQILANTSKKFKDRTAADDFTLVYQYYKYVDPTSVVRETEFENLQNLGSVGEKIKTIIPKWTKGTTLSEDKVKDLESAMNASFPSFVEEQSERENTYKKILEDGGFDTSYFQSFIPKEKSSNNINSKKKIRPRGMGSKSNYSEMTTEELIEEYKKLKGIQ